MSNIQDTFARPNTLGGGVVGNADGWGVASDGTPWFSAGENGTFQVVGNQGQVIGGAVGGTTILAGNETYTDVDIVVRLSTSVSSTANWQGIVARVQNATHYYVGFLRGTNISIVRYGGANPIIATAAFTQTAGAEYYLRFRLIGTTLTLKGWADGVAEPSTWNLTVSDAFYTTGRVGLLSNPNALTTTAVFDSLVVSDYANLGARWHAPKYTMRALTGKIVTPIENTPPWTARAFGSVFVRPTSIINIPHQVRRGLSTLLSNYRLNAAGRMIVQLGTSWQASGRMRVSGATTAIKNGIGRLLTSANATKTVVGRLLTSVKVGKSGTGRLRSSTTSTKRGIGRFLTSTIPTKNAIGRYRLSIKTIKTVSGRLRSSSRAVKNALGRIGYSSALVRKVLGRFLFTASSRVEDTFVKANISANTVIATGWGIATDGNIWSKAGGTPNWAVTSNKGTVTNSTADNFALLSATTFTDVEDLVRFSTTSTSISNWVGPIVRYSGVGAYYSCNIRSGNIILQRVGTSLNSAGFAITANTSYWIRLRAVGTSLKGKIWADGTAEPTTWTVSATDATYTSGQVGLYISPDALGTVTSFDSFHANDSTFGTVIAGVTNCYVSTHGNDITGDGSLGFPWATPMNAASLISGGETVHVDDGTYTVTSATGNISINASGTDDAHRTVFTSLSRGGAKIVNNITTTGNTTNDPTFFVGANYVDIVGFDISGVNALMGIYSYGKSGVGSGTPAGSHNRIRNNIVHDLGTSVPLTHNTAAIDFGQYGHTPTYCANYNEASGNTVRNVGFPGNTGSHGIYFGTAYGVAQNNIISNCPGFGLRAEHFPNHMTFSNNLIFKCGSDAPAGGDGLHAGGGIFLSAGGTGWVSGVDEPCDFCVTNNNIVRDCIGYGGVYEYANGITPVSNDVANNTFSNNAYFGNAGTVANPFHADSGAANSNTVTTDPLFVNYQADGTGNYHLTGGSPCVNKGTLVSMPVLDYDATIRTYPDIGPYTAPRTSLAAVGRFLLTANFGIKNAVGRFKSSAIKAAHSVGRVNLGITTIKSATGRLRVAIAKRWIGRILVSVRITKSASGRLLSSIRVTKSAIGRFLSSAKTTKNSAGRVKVALQATRSGLGRYRSSIKTLSSATGRLRSSTTMLRNGMGRFRSNAQHTLTGTGRFKSSIKTIRSGIGRFRLAITKSSTGRYRSSAKTISSAIGRIKISTGTVAVKSALGRLKTSIIGGKNGKGRLPLGILTLKNAIGRYKASIQTKRQGIGRFLTSIKSNKNGVGRFRSSATVLKSAVGRIRASIVITRSTIGRAYIAIVHKSGVVGRLPLKATAVRSSIGRIRITFGTIIVRTMLGRVRVSASDVRSVAGRINIVIATIDTVYYIADNVSTTQIAPASTTFGIAYNTTVWDI